MKKTPRPYQQAAIDTAIQWHKYKPETPAIISIPTGGGKTIILSELISHYYDKGLDVCLLAHRQELLTQSGDCLDVPFTYYSAGIGEKEIESRAVVAGIQSIYNKKRSKPFDVILIDECHRVPNNNEMGQYWQFINSNPNALLIGLTATPYRLKGGKLSWGEVVYSISYNDLLNDSYLTKLTNKVKHTPNLDNVKVTAGEYNLGELEAVMSDGNLVLEAVKAIKAYSDVPPRYSILIFCVSVAHASVLTEVMKANGLQSAMISGDTPQAERKQTLDDFKSGRLHHLINCEILLEGFDAPNIDMIVCLRPTKSKSLHEQMLGRGVRLFEGKEDCLLIDMAGNLMEHGALGTPYREKARGETKKEAGRICPECESFNKVTAKECEDCGYVFIKEEPPKASHNYEPDTNSNMEYAPFYEYEVTGVSYRQHIKKGTTDKISFRVDYACPEAKYGAISEWLSPWNESEWARGKAHQFFKERGVNIEGDIKDKTIEELLFLAIELKTPSHITVDHNEKFPRIKGYRYETKHRGGNPEGASEVDTTILNGDTIPF